ncbi:MAG: DNA repair protein RecO [Gammaproteobacteria bacterium]|nr:DNA repair protein RecO [Gammaproteobacteria bacterium]
MSNLEPAFILHRYPYQDHSFILKLFSPQSGFVTAIAKGAKQPKSPWHGLLQPFAPLLVKCKGRGEVVGLQIAEPAGKAFSYKQANLLSGFYLNELLMSFLHPHQEYPALFSAYHQALEGLGDIDFEGHIRNFELSLLLELGLAPELSIDEDHKPILVSENYLVRPGNLPRKGLSSQRGLVLSGKELLAIERREWQNDDTLRAAKLLLRNWIHYYTKGKVFKSREIFREGLANDKPFE